MTLRSYVVNLDRSPECLAAMARQRGGLGLEWQRPPAVDGRALAPDIAARHGLSGGHLAGCLSHRAV